MSCGYKGAEACHAAIGGDTDGQGGVDGAPHEIDTVADY